MPAPRSRRTCGSLILGSSLSPSRFFSFFSLFTLAAFSARSFSRISRLSYCLVFALANWSRPSAAPNFLGRPRPCKGKVPKQGVKQGAAARRRRRRRRRRPRRIARVHAERSRFGCRAVCCGGGVQHFRALLPAPHLHLAVRALVGALHASRCVSQFCKRGKSCGKGHACMQVGVGAGGGGARCGCRPVDSLVPECGQQLPSRLLTFQPGCV